MTTTTDDARSIPLRWLAAALLVGLALRAWEAWESSLWLDELHTLSHASLPTLAAVREHVAREYHTPLYFMATHLLGGWEQGAALRVVPVLSSLLVFVPLIALTRAARGSTRALALAAWLFACVPYLVHWSTELRPYAWLMLFSAGAVWAAFAEDRSRVARFAVFFACALLGIWTHRFMAFTVFAIGFARLWASTPRMLHLGWLVLAGSLAVALSWEPISWFLGFAQVATERRLEYQDGHGGWHLRRALVMEFAQLPVRLFVPYSGALGSPWSWIAALAWPPFLAIGVCVSMLRLVWRGPVRSGAAPVARGLTIYAITYFVVVTAASYWTWDRFPLQYYAPIAWLLPLLVALGADALETRTLRTIVVTVLGVGACVLGIAQAGGASTENMRGAVEVARAEGAKLEKPLYTALLSQPSLFEHTLPFKAYGRDLGAVEPETVPNQDASGFERPVVILLRNIRYSGALEEQDERWLPLIAGRHIARELEVDPYLTVLVLEADSTRPPR